MPIQHVDPEHIHAIQTSLKREFPSLTIETFPADDAQTYSLKLDAAALHRVSVTYARCRDTEDVVTQLRSMRLADELRTREREPLLVMTDSIREDWFA